MKPVWPPEPEQPPIDISAFDWFLQRWEERPSVFSRNQDSRPDGYLNLRFEPGVTATLDWGDRKATFFLKRKP